MAGAPSERELQNLRDDLLLLKGRDWALAQEIRRWDVNAAERTGIGESFDRHTVAAAADAALNLEQRAVRAVARRQVIEEHVEHKAAELARVREATQALRERNRELAQQVAEAMAPVFAWAERVHSREQHLDGVDPDATAAAVGAYGEEREAVHRALLDDIQREQQKGDELLRLLQAEQQEADEALQRAEEEAAAELARARRDWRREKAELKRQIEWIEVRWQEKRFHVNRGSHFKETKSSTQIKVPHEERLDAHSPGLSGWMRDAHAREERDRVAHELGEASLSGAAMRKHLLDLRRQKRAEELQCEQRLRAAQEELGRLTGAAEQRLRERRELAESRAQLFATLHEDLQSRGQTLAALTTCKPGFKHTSTGLWHALCRGAASNGGVVPQLQSAGARSSTPGRQTPSAAGTPGRARPPSPGTSRGGSTPIRARATSPSASATGGTPHSTPRRRSTGSAARAPKRAPAPARSAAAPLPAAARRTSASGRARKTE
eukprot:TRINITY_DN56677_c0_g1_i1.p1 TRINITY_DN56677_c0_g1~~TRINITY_DN56677_c0_g1_i1.p1  ORF type:complete len:528 (+),score=177.29 TRINITY_DN56677_c0_g1_i1:103-1584(+)